MLHAKHNKLENSRGGVNTCKWLCLKPPSASPFRWVHFHALPVPLQRRVSLMGFLLARVGCWCRWARVPWCLGSLCGGLALCSFGLWVLWGHTHWSSSKLRLLPLLLKWDAAAKKPPTNSTRWRTHVGLSREDLLGSVVMFAFIFPG